MNNKGFTLIEALAVIVLLGIVLAIGGYSVANYLSDSKEKSIDVFKKNIKSGMINCYNECKYLKTDVCDSDYIKIGTKKDEYGKIIEYNLKTNVRTLIEFGFLDNQYIKSLQDVESFEQEGLLPITQLISCELSITYDKVNQEFSEKVTYSAPEGMENPDVCKNLNNE